MSNPLNLEESALLAKMKRDLEETKQRLDQVESELEEEEEESLSHRIYSLIDQNAKIVNVNVFDETIEFDLSDDRMISIPMWWSWKLEQAEEWSRQNYLISEDESRVVWPDLNEEISVTGILAGDPAPRPDEE
mgnify:FL=1